MKNLHGFLLSFGTMALLVACSDDTSAPQNSAGATPPAPAVVNEASAPPVIEMAPVESPVEATVEPPVAAVESREESTASATTETKAPSAVEAAPQQYTIKGVVTQWAPLVLFVQPGDQIVFRQMTGHDTTTIEGMYPEGAQAWQSKLGAEGFAITLDVPGVYIYKCTPHVSLGMIGAIVVGDTVPHNLPALESHPQNKGMIGRAIRKLKQALDEKNGA